MSDLTINYKGNPIVEMTESGAKTLKTAGKYCEGDISVAYSKPAGGVDMGITGATVGQIAKITAVDASGVPTAWSPVDMPSGGGGAWEVIADQTLDIEAASVSFNFDVTYRRLWFVIYGVPASGSNANLDVRFDDISFKRIQLPNAVPGHNTSAEENKRGAQIYLEKINGGFAFILCSLNNGSVFPNATMFSPVFDIQKVDWGDISKAVFYATGTSFSAGSIFKLWGCK